MTFDHILANIALLTAEATEIRRNREQIERAEALIETAKQMVAFASELLELADLIGDNESYVRYAHLYCRAELHLGRAQLALFRASTKPHSWGRYTDACLQLEMLRTQAERMQRAPVTMVPMAIAVEC